MSIAKPETTEPMSATIMMSESTEHEGEPEPMSATSTQLALQAPKGSKSPLWLHFAFEVDKDGKHVSEKVVHCRLCFREVGYSGNTTNL